MRSNWKGPVISQNILQNLKVNENYKVFCRNSVIPSNLIGKTLQIYNGKFFKKIVITREKVGYKLNTEKIVNFELVINYEKITETGIYNIQKLNELIEKLNTTLLFYGHLNFVYESLLLTYYMLNYKFFKLQIL